ncbi:MAG TPA: DUF1800 domain-containing protein [Gemmatimonadaceae bacterium]|nr:DUF1800 domain-containing protein [Gemmatimonadaceae bacterium]
MRRSFSPILRLGSVAVLASCASAATQHAGDILARRNAALSREDRARQVLNRLTFGPRPGEVAEVERMGADRWIELQLRPEQIPDRAAEAMLARLETQHKRPFELIADHPAPEELAPRLQPRVRADSARVPPNARDSAEYRQAQQTANALAAQIPVSKLLHATLSERQLLEVMVDFWENHFSVSINKSPNRYSLVEYDRDVIRPHALGKFRDLLGAVAKSPQMLYYLDNWQSLVDSLHPTIAEGRIQARREAMRGAPMGDSLLLRLRNGRRSGLNENYGRELMELHTLGVGGGYTQRDVVEVARCLTGWTIDRPDLGGRFLFRHEWHDGGEKLVLGNRIAAGGGVEDGEGVLDILARHPSTARFIAWKLAVHFVSDSAPPALVERAAQRFSQTDGDIREVMRTIIVSPEFFAAGSYRAKVKTPFELVASTVRAMNAQPDTTTRTAGIVAKLGQPIWGRQTPDGWPDQGAPWINAGSLLNRLNFGESVAAGQVPGVTIAAWRPTPSLLAAPADLAVRGVIDELLEGRAAEETRRAMLKAMSAPDGRAPLVHLGQVVAVAIGSPEFQRR